ncbi:MAG TPA: AraC family transcriptional regulator [Cytophagaceae bacterium]|jgi:AraC-like DNA-binding protein
MDNTLKNFYLEKNFGLFVGTLINNRPHSHYAFQVSVNFVDPLILTTNREKIAGAAFFINSKVTHKLESPDFHLTILINPLCSLGHKLRLTFGNTDVTALPEDLSHELKTLLESYCSRHLQFKDFIKKVTGVFQDFNGTPLYKSLNKEDSRILNALTYLDSNFDRVVSLNEIAALCSISETRFLHLFKETTSLNFRRFQLWNRLINSIPHLKELTITETAHMYGFTDSSHYCRPLQRRLD